MAGEMSVEWAEPVGGADLVIGKIVSPRMGRAGVMGWHGKQRRAAAAHRWAATDTEAVVASEVRANNHGRATATVNSKLRGSIEFNIDLKITQHCCKCGTLLSFVCRDGEKVA